MSFPNLDARGPFWPGSDHSATLEIRNQGAEAARDIVIRLRASAATVTEISSHNMNWRRTQEGWLAALAGIGPNETVLTTLSVRLDGTAGDPTRGDEPGEVSVSLQARGVKTPIAVGALWPVADCSSAYHRALVAIRAEADPRIKAALKNVKSGDPALPGNWIFQPATSRPPKEQLRADALARTAISNRGQDPYLRSEPIEWLSGRLSRDLRRYLGQEPYAGLCTPVAPMLAFLRDKLGQLDARMSNVARDRNTTLAAARDATRGALAEIRLAASADPLGGLPQDTLVLSEEAGLRQLLTSLTTVLAIAVPAPDPPHAGQDILADLIASNNAFRAHPALRTETARHAGRPSKLGTSVFAALTAIERAAYLERLSGEYVAFHGAFADTMSDIEAANREHCICKY